MNMPRWENEPLNIKNPRLIVARKLIRAGYITSGEAAGLLGYSRQHLYTLTQDLQPVRRRAAYLRSLWQQALDEEKEA